MGFNSAFKGLRTFSESTWHPAGAISSHSLFLVIVDLTKLRFKSKYVSSTDRRNVKNEMEETWKIFDFSGISLEKMNKISGPIVCALAKIRNWHFPYTSQNYYSTIQLLRAWRMNYCKWVRVVSILRCNNIFESDFVLRKLCLPF